MVHKSRASRRGRDRHQGAAHRACMIGCAMDIHPPTKPIESAKDFVIHLSMIVIGILIAIGLEQTVEAWHHHECWECRRAKTFCPRFATTSGPSTVLGLRSRKIVRNWC